MKRTRKERSVKLKFEEQVSDKPETCSRCAQLRRDVVINSGERHWALIEDPREMDAPPRVILCEPCRRFLHHAETHAR